MRKVAAWLIVSPFLIIGSPLFLLICFVLLIGWAFDEISDIDL